MNSQEFTEWYAAHLAAFPSLQAWMDSLDQDRDGLSVDVLARWQRTLQQLSLGAAMEATEQLARSQTQYRFDKHADMVATLGGKSAPVAPKPPKIVGDEVAYRCTRCRDEGLVSIAVLLTEDKRRIVNKEIIAEHVRRYGLDRRAITSAAVRCWCPLGERFIKHTMLSNAHQDFDDLVFAGVAGITKRGERVVNSRGGDVW